MPTVKESEKVLEKQLAAQVIKLGGWTLKLLPTFVRGLPDRLCLLPGGVVFFAEIKSTGKKPTPVQAKLHEKIRRLGFSVYVIDSTAKLNETLNFYLF